MNNNSKKGFASMSEERRKEIASKGGQTAHSQGKAHKFTSEEARAAGIKGALARTQKRNACSV